MTPPEKCMRTWMGKDGKEHYCTLPKGHVSLQCFCEECNVGKWFGKKLTSLNKSKAQP